MNETSLKKTRFWQRIFRRPKTTEKKQKKKITFETTRRIREVFAVIFLTLICFAAIYQQLELLAIVSILFIGIIVYKRRVIELADTSLDLLGRTNIAKLGEVELSVHQKYKDYSALLQNQAEWIRIILSDLTSEQISLLLAIYHSGRYEAREKNQLRALRARGLLLHNAPTLGDSNEVWLSELGKDLASSLIPENEMDKHKENS